MAEISDIVSVTITRDTSTVSQAGFGTMLILGPNAVFGELVRSYSNLTAVAEDFATTDAEYKAARAAFAQTPRPTTLKIGKRATTVAQVQTIVFSADLITSNSVACTIDGVALTATPFNTSNAQTLTDLAAKIQATAGVATAVSDGSHTITCTAATAGIPFTISGVLVTAGASQATAAITTTVDNVGVEEDLIAVTEEDDDWYALVLTSVTSAEVQIAAGYIETVNKIFITRTNDANTLVEAATTDIGYILSAANYTRTAVIYNATSDDYIDAAWLGRCLPEDPGQINFMFRELAGITSDDLTSSERANALEKNVNVYVPRGGSDMTEKGVMAAGIPNYIDIIRDTDYIQARLMENVYDRLISTNKIPYTDAGVAIIENEVRGVLQNAVAAGILADFTVSVPKVADVSSEDKENRLLPDVTFTGTYAGAINGVTITGTLSF